MSGLPLKSTELPMPWEGGDIVPIKWSALKVSEAADKIEELINQAAEPLEQARIVAQEARKIDNLPQYIGQGLNSIVAEIERVTGGEVSWSKEHQDGSIKRAIDRLRDDIPKDAIQSDQTSQKYGSTQSFV
jgi:hypothetical protein